jgi:hypothetical protein
MVPSAVTFPAAARMTAPGPIADLPEYARNVRSPGWTGPSSSVYQRAAADRSSAHRFMVLIPRSTDEMFLCARRAHTTKTEAEIKTSFDHLTGAQQERLGHRSLFPPPYSVFGGMLIPRNGLAALDAAIHVVRNTGGQFHKGFDYDQHYPEHMCMRNRAKRRA